jgi:hypothetical protein
MDVPHLILETAGFEGLAPLRKDLETDDLAISDGPEVSDPVLHYRATAARPRADHNQHHDPIPVFQELFRLDHHFLERLKQIFEEAPGFLATAICPRAGYAIGRYQFEVRRCRLEDGIPVSAIEGLVTGSKRLDVGLRHRLRPYRFPK